MEDRATPEVGKRRKGIMRPPRPHMTHFELPGNLFSDLSLPTPAPENLTAEKETLSVKVHRSSVLLSPFRCSQVIHEHSMFRREVTKGTLCKEAVREVQGTVTHRTERGQDMVSLVVWSSTHHKGPSTGPRPRTALLVPA